MIIFGSGNPSRGDDALAPALLRRMAQAKAQSPEWAAITLVEDFQLQIEHALDLVGQDRALFVDASVSCRAPYEFTRLSPVRNASYTSHAIDPGALLHVYAQTQRETPPPSYLLAIRGERFDLGGGLSAEGRSNLEAAYVFLCRLLASSSAEFWDSCAGRG